MLPRRIRGYLAAPVAGRTMTDIRQARSLVLDLLDRAPELEAIDEWRWLSDLPRRVNDTRSADLSVVRQCEAELATGRAGAA